MGYLSEVAIVIEDYGIKLFRVLEVPYEKDGVCLYFNGKPKLLCECAYNDITEAMLSTLHSQLPAACRSGGLPAGVNC
ncbi:hypothetical protein AN618_18980 [Fervidicola ferrireducens]|uniref:Uncharacterized protein n=1 Tax=Fervidicola ferrireducens TaxID=520764 RepID=A0A140L4Q0_9FIRM|nr:hypothetical protein [Fervidicola ferrireducens]KXG75525.1 hypothetical protein AN618_18980 [Fervidicola ferrireducens]